jgi:uncharacterized protein
MMRSPALAPSFLRTLARWGLALALASLQGLAHSQALQAIPPLSARIIDTTSTLKAEQVQAIEARLRAFEAARGTQIVVLMVPTTAPEDITDFTQRVGDAWKIGRRDIGDGLLVIIAKNDRTLRIAPAKALEGAVPDLAARQVIDRSIAPRFREGDFAGGIDAGLSRLMALIAGEALPEPRGASGTAKSASDWTDALVLLLVAVPVLARRLTGWFGRKLACLVTGLGAGLLTWASGAGLILVLLSVPLAVLWGLIATMATWRVHPSRSHGDWANSSGRSGTWSDGGFRSGGGGNFGGGGASGRW